VTHWKSFPSRLFPIRRALFRIHRTINGPFWFNDDGGWRFDPPLTHRGIYGVCYLGLEPLASYVEVFGRTGAIPHSSITERQLSTVAVSRDLNLADLTDRHALGYGINATYSVGSDYGHSQQLSAVLHDAGFDGIYYRVRHDPGMELSGVAMFGPPGENSSSFDAPTTANIPPDLVAEGRTQFGLEVFPISSLP
jgi:RES domain